MNQLWKIVLVGLLFISMLGVCQTNVKGKEAGSSMCSKADMRDIIGVSHVIGRYHLTNKDFLNEGADEILGIGARVIKLWFYNAEENPQLDYPYNSKWPQVSTLVEGAKTPYWKAVFKKPFTTYLLCHQSMGVKGYYFNQGITDQQAAEDERQTYELAKHFLTEYKGTGKTFVFCSSEIDWHLQDMPIGPDQVIPHERFGYLKKWLTARQAGIERARNEVGMDGVRVFHAMEVVNVMKCLREGGKAVVNTLLPELDIDLVGYSAYDSTVYDGIHDRKDLKDALDYIASNARQSKYFGRKNVFIAEWGLPENEFSQEDLKKLTHNVVETGLEWGCPYIVHWQLYCNESNGTDRVPYHLFADNPCWDPDKFRGFWLIRPDGSKNYTYHYLKQLCRTNKLPEYKADKHAQYSYKPCSEIVGSTHVKSNYYFGKKDSLNEGADRLLEMGTQVIKVWFYMVDEYPDVMYRWNSDWPRVDSLVEEAKLPYWKNLFDKPFKTYILQVMEMVPMQRYYWRDNFTPEQEQEVERQMYELAKYLLMTYQGTGKTFILSNHETDWHLENDWGNWEIEAPDHVYKNAIRWFSARQRGVQKARKELGMTRRVQVLHAGEVVHVVRSMKNGQKNMVNQILPYVNFDLVSYSCYDSTVIGGIQEKKLLIQALDYIEDNLYDMKKAEGDAADNNYFGKKRVFIGEFGLPENDFNETLMLGLTQNVIEAGLEWGCPYIVYWQLYCNEPRPNVTVPSSKNEDSRGFWLIRPDGSKTSTYEYLKNLIKNKH